MGRWRRNREESQDAGAPASDDILVRAAQADPTAFAALYDRYVDRVYRYCYRQTGNVAGAEDATSVTFFKALAALPRFNNDVGAFRPWLFAIAHNVVIDQGRAAQRRPESSIDAHLEFESAEPSPETLVIAADERAQLLAAMDELPHDQRRVIALRLAGLSGPEIAAEIDRSPGAVRVAQHRAIGKLRTILGADPINPDACNENGGGK